MEHALLRFPIDGKPDFDVIGFSPAVSILVVSYNTCDMTLECLRSIKAETTVSYELIVIDNFSDDGSVEAIDAEFPDITLLAETENHGFAKGNNIGAEHAQGEYLLLLNPDTLVQDRAIDQLIAFAERTPESRIWGGRTLFKDGSLNPTSCWRRMSLWTLFCRTTGLTGVFSASALFNSEAYGGWDRVGERQVDIVTGCFFLIKRADWQVLDGFDLTFFMYGEEADLCRRAEHRLGALPRTSSEATIVHYGGASEKDRPDRVVRILRAKGELIKRYFPFWQQPLARLLFVFFPYSRRFAARVGLQGSRGENAKIWEEVWQRRAEWKDGFSNLI